MFEGLEAILSIIAITLVLLLAIVLFQKRKRIYVNGFSLVILSLLSLYITIQIIYTNMTVVDEGITVNELTLSGSVTLTVVIVLIGSLAFLNPLIYLFKNMERNNS